MGGDPYDWIAGKKLSSYERMAMERSLMRGQVLAASRIVAKSDNPRGTVKTPSVKPEIREYLPIIYSPPTIYDAMTPCGFNGREQDADGEYS